MSTSTPHIDTRSVTPPSFLREALRGPGFRDSMYNSTQCRAICPTGRSPKCQMWTFFMVSWALHTLSYSQGHREQHIASHCSLKGIVTFLFFSLCVSRVSWLVPDFLTHSLGSHSGDNSCWFVLCALSSVSILWLLNIKCGHAKRCFWHLWMLQVVETSTWARISPHLSGPFCPLWNACGKKSVHELSSQQLMWGRGAYVNVLWQLRSQRVQGCFTGRALTVMCWEKINIFHSPGSQPALKNLFPPAQRRPQARSVVPRKQKMLSLGKGSCWFCWEVCLSSSSCKTPCAWVAGEGHAALWCCWLRLLSAVSPTQLSFPGSLKAGYCGW